jgi:hypothetical protein
MFYFLLFTDLNVRHKLGAKGEFCNCSVGM